MSGLFFDELDIPRPDVDLGIGSGPHGAQTAAMLAGIERALLAERPDGVVVFGDTNSTLAGALAATKLRIPLAHVEAGLRSYNREMPEEHNRVLTDHCSDLLLCPTRTAVENLAREGVTRGVRLAGDPMYDAVLRHADAAAARTRLLDELGVAPGGYLLATVHRAGNVDAPERLAEIVAALAELEEPVVFPVHPRTRQRIDAGSGAIPERVKLVPPVGYLDMLALERGARVVLTDSGGVQKEAYFLGVPCVTLREETEWVETLEHGWNRLAGSDRGRIVAAVAGAHAPDAPRGAFGDGRAGERIVRELEAGIDAGARR